MNREMSSLARRRKGVERNVPDEVVTRELPNYKGIGLRKIGKVDVGSGAHKCRVGVADHKYFCAIQPPILGKSLQGRSHLFSRCPGEI
jgi:hypothetical protein